MKLKTASVLFLCAIAVTIPSACHTTALQSKTTTLLPDLSVVKPSPAPPTVVYIHGWQILQRKKYAPKLAERKQVIQRSIEDVYPGSPVIWLNWKSAIPWDKSLSLANKVAEDFGRELLSLSKDKRENLIVVGHSIGCDIAISAVAMLNEYNAKIKRLVLLGAAIRRDKGIVTQAIYGSAEPAVIVFCPKDGMLRSLMSWTENSPALGVFGYTGTAQEGIDYVQYECPPSFSKEKWMYNHWSAYYMMFLRKTGENVVPQPVYGIQAGEGIYQGNVVFPWLWITERETGNTLLQVNRFNPSHARILSEDCMVHEGALSDIQAKFDNITKKKQNQEQK